LLTLVPLVEPKSRTRKPSSRFSISQCVPDTEPSGNTQSFPSLRPTRVTGWSNVTRCPFNGPSITIRQAISRTFNGKLIYSLIIPPSEVNAAYQNETSKFITRGKQNSACWGGGNSYGTQTSLFHRSGSGLSEERFRNTAHRAQASHPGRAIRQKSWWICNKPCCSRPLPAYRAGLWSRPSR